MKGCVSALFVVALYIVILVGCDFGILAAILTIVAFYGLFELLTTCFKTQKIVDKYKRKAYTEITRRM